MLLVKPVQLLVNMVVLLVMKVNLEENYIPELVSAKGITMKTISTFQKLFASIPKVKLFVIQVAKIAKKDQITVFHALKMILIID